MPLGVTPLSLLKLPTGRVVRRLRSMFRRECFDLHHLAGLNRFLLAADSPPLSLDPKSADADVLAASRFVLARLVKTLRKRSPQALSQGVDGQFARMLLASDTGLSQVGKSKVRAAFEYAHRVRAERCYEIRDDLRTRFPLALTPAQRGEFLDWFAASGRSDEPDVDPISLLWCLFEHDEEPSRGLEQSYLMQPAWQERFPHALTRFGWRDFKKWVAAEHHFRDRWWKHAEYLPRYGSWDELALLLHARPDLARTFPNRAALDGDIATVVNWLRLQRLPGLDSAWERLLGVEIRDGLPARIGVNVLGFFRYPSGLQQAATVLVRGLEEVGVRTEIRDIPTRNARDRRKRTGFTGLERFPISILNAGLDTSCFEAYRDAGLHRRPDAYRIAVWWWELSRLPADWLDRGRDVYEIWAPTRFIEESLQSLNCPIHLMPPSVELPIFEAKPKSAFGLAADKFTFLFAFDMNSRMARKNPLGLIRAFRLAFEAGQPVELAIKVSQQESHWPEQWRELRRAAAEAGVKLIERGMPHGELLALMNAADAYVSMHRSEGFGLTMAEAMLMGKPTVATAYSGNVDFMTPDNSYLIDYSLVPITAAEVKAPPGAVWAEPSVEHAAQILRAIVDDPDKARAKGLLAQAELRVKLSHRAAGERMAARLRAILGGRR